MSLDCYLLSPVHIRDKINFLIPPVVYSRNIYIIKENLFLEILTKIGLFQEYNQTIKEKGYNYTSKWLAAKDLLNEGFLENISQYWISNVDIRKITDYMFFQKDLYNNPIISKQCITNIFKKAILFNYIKEKKDEFNAFAQEELHNLENELSVIKNLTMLNDRQDIYKKTIFKFLLEKFFVNIDVNLSQSLQNLENIDVVSDLPLNFKDLTLYRVGHLSNYKSSKFKITDIVQQECLKENTRIKLQVNFNKQIAGFGDEYLDYLLNQVSVLAQDKLNFDKNYLACMLANNAKSGMVNALNTINGCVKNIEINDQPSRNNIAVKKKELKENSIINYYNSIKDSNFLICSNSELNKLIVLLNLEKSNINKLGELFYGDNYKYESDLVKVSLEKGNLPYSPLGFANIVF